MKHTQRTGGQKNSGFSLLEVVVAIMVIAIISIPIIRSFVTSADVNKKARRVQDATDVAQSVAEYIGKIPYDDVLSLSARNASTFDKDNIKFEGLHDWRAADGGDIFYGASGEKFTVDVDMVSRPESSSFVVKNYDIAELKDLFGNNAVSCMDQIIKYDQAAMDSMGIASPASAMKTTTFTIDISKDTVTGRFNYTYKVQCSYLNGATPYTGDEMMLDSGQIEADSEFPSLYVAYKVFNTTLMNDKIVINYNNSCTTADNCPRLRVCLIQQYAEGADHAELKLNRDSSLVVNQNLTGGIIVAASPFICLDNFDSNNKITESTGRQVKIYDIDVSVKLNDKVLAHVSTVREDLVK